jgi:prepilin-type N-terminal cleavage/methylation domain-containing protein
MRVSVMRRPRLLRAARRADGPGDRGVTLVELAVAIALMGIIVVAVLVSLQTTTKGSTIDRDQAKAFEWLQAASDRIFNGPRTPCYSTSPTPLAAYDAIAQTAQRPQSWDPASGATIEVVSVAFLGRTTDTAPLEWKAASTHCLESEGCPANLDDVPSPIPSNWLYCAGPLTTQKVTIKATGPGGVIVNTLEMVKSA